MWAQNMRRPHYNSKDPFRLDTSEVSKHQFFTFLKVSLLDMNEQRPLPTRLDIMLQLHRRPFGKEYRRSDGEDGRQQQRRPGFRQDGLYIQPNHG